MNNIYVFTQLVELVKDVHKISEKDSVQFNIIIRNIKSEYSTDSEYSIVGNIVLNSILSDSHLSNRLLDNKSYSLTDFNISIGYTNDHLSLKDFLEHKMWFIDNFTSNTSYYKYGYCPPVLNGNSELILYPWIEKEREKKKN